MAYGLKASNCDPLSLYKHAGQLVYENVKRETDLKMSWVL